MLRTVCLTNNPVSNSGDFPENASPGPWILLVSAWFKHADPATHPVHAHRPHRIRPLPQLRPQGQRPDPGDLPARLGHRHYEHILADHRQFSTAPLRIFFDTQDIKDAEDWRHRILHGLRESKMLLVCLSPNYFASAPCRWEWEEYVKRQVHQLMGSESVVTVYFVEVPGSAEQANAKWLEELMRGNFTDLRPWFPEGAAALQRAEVRAKMACLGETLWERLQRARRAAAVPGNLRWQNPHFVGRREELRKLHEQLGTGAVGVVTAVQGLGGQGKTELAVAYAHGWADSYPAGLWSLGAEGKTELLPLIGELAWERALGFTPTEAEKNDPVLLGRSVLEHLKQRAEAVKDRDPDRGAACLLLLDNVSEPALLSPAQLATLPGGLGSGWLRIVATTRLEVSKQKDRLAVLTVDALDDDSALTLIRDHQPFRDARHRPVTDPEQSVPKGVPTFASETEEAAALEIVRALGGFTLAVEQVALYLGLHPEVTPSAFFATLQARGLPVADTLPQRDADVALQMRTQSKQLALILDATLARLDAPARTALQFAALLPPDTVPWPWLRALTVARHPELGEKDDLGADPWLALQRRLTGLRLLTPGDHPEIARIHRLVAAHLQNPPAHPPQDKTLGDLPAPGAADHPPEGQRPENTPAQGNALGSGTPHQSSPEGAAQTLDRHLGQRADHLYRTQDSPADWELDALLLTLPLRLGENTGHSLANDALFLTGKIVTYRTLPAAATFLATVHSVIERLAASDPANAEWQRDLSVSLIKLGDLAVAQGDLAGALRYFTQDMAIAERLAASDPANAEWQR
ncbi:MAG: toll/interleukin-1 receptor domain-containing protein, partial [Verrucomicrobia bacterium]|nr:toll/interleukin-1 receptor domain-containing protein [Verrucomicrobiota bacterium]